MSNSDSYFNQDILLFDGVCSLCNRSVEFIIRNEKGDKLKFASLQSDLGKEILVKNKIGNLPDSMILFREGRFYCKSAAALRACQYLKRPYSILSIFRIVPTPITDVFYNIIARNRYKWFGKRSTCRVPSEKEKTKILG